MTVRGLVGEIRQSWYLACELRDWIVTDTALERSLTATCVAPDTFRLSQRPLVFLARHATGAYRWPILELQMAGASLTARLGPREKAHGAVSIR